MSSEPSPSPSLPFRPLGTTFVKNTYHYELIIRDGNWAIFKQRLRPGVGELAYEVIRIRVAPACVIQGRLIEAREVGPSNEAFGRDGFTYPTLTQAKAKLHEMVSKRDT